MMKRLLPLNCILLCLLLLPCACIGSPEPVPTPAPVPAATEAAPAVETEDVLLPRATAAETPVPTPKPSETPTPSPSPTPTPDLRFSIVWVSDTQEMIAHARMREDYLALCDWVRNEANARNFVLFLHSGDMVDDGDVPGQWELFNRGAAAISERVPFFWTAGNHDEGQSYTSPWKKQPFMNGLPDEQKYNGGDASFYILTVGDTQILFLSICWRRIGDAKTIAWLKSVCDAHAELPAVLLTHGYLSAKKERIRVAEKLEKQLVAVCPNLRLILCGHARGIARETFAFDDDGDGIRERTVNVLMYDLQTDTSHYGYVCILTYDPLGNTLAVDSYSPVRDDYVYDDAHADRERFTLYDVF